MKATIPDKIADWLELKNKDKLQWEMQVLAGKRCALVWKK